MVFGQALPFGDIPKSAEGMKFRSGRFGIGVLRARRPMPPLVAIILCPQPGQFQMNLFAIQSGH
jgi:hypothetical protein